MSEFAYRALLCSVPHLAPPDVLAAAKWLRAERAEVVEAACRGDFTLLASEERFRGRQQRQDMIALAALEAVDHPDIWDVEGDCIGTDASVVLHLGGTREQATRLRCGPWLRLIDVTEFRVARPGRLDEVDTDSLTGYAWGPRTGWDLDAETASLACPSAED